MSESAKEAILAAATLAAQAHGYGGLNFRALAAEVGIKAASIYYHFPSKAELGAAVARRYWEATAATLERISAENPDPIACLRQYPDVFRKALATGHRMCLGSYMAAERDDLPETVEREVQTFFEINVTWLARMLSASTGTGGEESAKQARAILAAIAGAQLLARSRSDIALYDTLIESYRAAGLLPG